MKVTITTKDIRVTGPHEAVSLPRPESLSVQEYEWIVAPIEGYRCKGEPGITGY